MIRPATYSIQQTFDERDVKYRVCEIGDSSVVEAGFVIDNGPNVIVHFISRDDDNDVAVRVFRLLKVSDDKRDSILAAINRLNCKFRYLKFTMNEDGSVHAENDLYLCTENVGEACFEMFARCMPILREAYPILMRALLE